jgi:hypothetical protein
MEVLVKEEVLRARISFICVHILGDVGDNEQDTKKHICLCITMGQVISDTEIINILVLDICISSGY